jgi:putative transposase
MVRLLRSNRIAMSYPHRLDPSQYAGCRLLFLTICTFDRAERFRDAAVVDLVVSHFLRTARECGIEVIAYCVMPDHVHLIVVGKTAGADMRRFVGLAKQRSGYEFARTCQGRLWQPSFFDRTIRPNEDVAEIIAYVIRNPVRARLVQDPADYPHWGSQAYSREEILAFVGSSPERRVRRA